MSAVATSGSYNDLADKPNFNQAPGHEYASRSNSLQNAATGNEYYVEIDGLRFRAYKSSIANYWGIRILNNTGAAVQYGSRGLHMYASLQMNNKGGSFADGTEFNPDTETSDIGYSKEDIFVTHFFDVTNMHLYRWTVSVDVNKSVMFLEKLY